jgi:hypothetical protein
VVLLCKVDIGLAAIDDDKLPLVIICKFDGLLRFVDSSYEFESNLILKIDRKMCQKKQTLLDDSHIGLKKELIFECRIDIFHECTFLVGFKRCFYHF